MAVNDLTIKMTGSYEGVMKELADNINSVNERILSISDLFTQVSLGDTSRLEDLNKIGKRSENDKLLPAMILMMSTIQNLIKEISVIADGAIDGKLETRSDILKFHGGFRDILEGLNKTLDAVEAPINESAEVLKEMEAGNLCVNMIGNYKGSYQIIKDSLNHTIESFNKLLGNITEASEQVLAGSNQVSDGSQALSQGTTEQASAIEELTSSITQVAAQTKQNAVNASQANELGINAKEVAILGNSHMKEMLKSMEEINVSSSNISKIIKVIDDIAFQTNMLALNAAVEAARAGQHGKGFAVVAEEVRNLAARSAKAAKETTDLVEGSIKKVEFGTKIANNTAESLNQIVLGVSKAATLVGEIAAASNEQATAIYQINKGIEQVSDVVQTNSATSEQSAAASEELSSQAAMLKNMVGKFNLKGSTSLAHNEISLEAQRNSNQIKNRFLTKDEVAVTKSKPVISLSNMEFGKY
ncbi:methyl-accepting chemotaxis protein [Clostridium estertheticum]|nr:methyl-accepting chemotaxis protein [Clostridium estertheticum]MBU3164956.1 methyl-accepting chemotaxis protein [Clostridium estertheticum]MBU3173889.1 methyl-accepting chemotaxis protein [Clostridium estertheticum]